MGGKSKADATNNIDGIIWTRTIALRITAIRQAKGMTQQKLAVDCKLARTSIVNMEVHRQGITLLNLYNIAKALGVNPKRLLP